MFVKIMPIFVKEYRHFIRNFQNILSGLKGFFEEVKKFTDARRAMKSIEFMYPDQLMDYMTYRNV